MQLERKHIIEAKYNKRTGINKKYTFSNPVFRSAIIQMLNSFFLLGI